MGGIQGRQSSENSPPDNAAGQNAARTITIGEVTSDRLKQRVTSHHRAENLSELHVGQVIGVDNGSACDGNIDSVEIRHGTEDEQPEHQKPAHAAGLCRSHHERSDVQATFWWCAEERWSQLSHWLRCDNFASGS